MVRFLAWILKGEHDELGSNLVHTKAGLSSLCHEFAFRSSCVVWRLPRYTLAAHTSDTCCKTCPADPLCTDLSCLHLARCKVDLEGRSPTMLALPSGCVYEVMEAVGSSFAVHGTVRFSRWAAPSRRLRQSCSDTLLVVCRRPRRKSCCTDVIVIVHQVMFVREETMAHTTLQIVSVGIRRVTWKVSCSQSCARTPSSHENFQSLLVSISQGRAGSGESLTASEPSLF